MKKLIYAVCFVLLMVSSPLFADDKKQDIPLVIAIEPDYFTFDPGYAYELYAAMVLGVTYDNLYEFVPESAEAIPQLAKSYSVSENGKEYTFKIREDAKFISGNKVMAKDVKFSFERAKHLMSNASALLENVSGVDVVDDYTVQVNLKKADSAFVAKTTTYTFAILDSELVIEKGGVSDESAAKTDKAQNWLDKHSAGSGPYIMKSFTPDDKLVLERNEKYWGKLPYFKTIIVQDMPDENAQLLAVKRNDIDIAFNLSADQLSQIEGAEGVNVISNTTMTMGFLMMNYDPAIGKQVSDPNVQKAIRYAVDYNGLQMLIGKGTLTPESFVQYGFIGSKAPIDPVQQTDLEKAKDFMAKSKYPKGFNIDFKVCDLAPEGIPLTLIAEKIKSDLAQIGINLNITQQTWGGGFGDAYRKGEIGFTAMYWGPDYNDPNTQLAFMPGQYVGLRAGWKAEMAPELAAQYDLILAETNNEKRKKMIEDVVTQTGTDSPFVVYAQYPKFIAASSELKGVTYSNVYRLDLTAISK